MPIYEYRCKTCNQTFEKMQRVSDPPMTTCPECSGAVVRLISASGLVFKGSGWYINDYAKKGTAEGATVAGTGGKTSKPSDPSRESDGAKTTSAESGAGKDGDKVSGSATPAKPEVTPSGTGKTPEKKNP